MDAQTVLDIFKEITTIPRESGHEAPMTEYLLRFAQEHSLQAKRDATGNVLITREAAPGYEHVPAIVLQSHQDMVCEKTADSTHDFAKDPIHYEIRDGWMVAPKTTLGADDGIGIAASLALLASDLKTGKLEALFTISEETGMDGAEALESGFFTGKTLINLDSEDEGQLFIGCAGGVNTTASLEYQLQPVGQGEKAVKVAIGGTAGGHSGDDINKGRINAVQQLARFLHSQQGWKLVSFIGGGKSNAIARECEAVILTQDPDGIAAALEAFGNTLRAEYAVSDPAAQVRCEPVSVPADSLSERDSRMFISAIWACPHGVYAMDQNIAGLVETSDNLASVKMPDGPGKFLVSLSERSSVASAKEAIKDRIQAHFELVGGKVEHKLPYPGWKPNPDSHILKVCVDAYKRLFNQEPLVLAIHAGLECGLFLEKFPELDMISFGPTLRGVHAPGERLELASMDKFVKLLTEVVCRFE